MSARQPRYGSALGATPPLFERLVKSDPPLVYDEAALRESVRAALEDLLGTRSPVPIERLETRPRRSSIDYGIPDLSAFPLGEAAAMARLASHLCAAIRSYEPRLQNAQVELVPGERPASLRAVVTGVLPLPHRRMPVRFELQVAHDGG